MKFLFQFPFQLHWYQNDQPTSDFFVASPETNDGADVIRPGRQV